MRIFKLVFVALIISLSLNLGAFCCDDVTLHQETISSVASMNKDLLEEKNNLPVTIANQRNNLNFGVLRRQNNDVNNNNTSIFATLPNKQCKNLFKYIKNQTYLENGAELALLPLMHQIQPNAP